MFTVLINNDNSSVVTERQRIMQNSKLVDTLQIIVPKTYNGLNMEDYKAYLEYLTPINHKHNYVELEISDNNYKNDYLLYKLSIDTDLTSEVGNIEFYMHFVKVVMNEDGQVVTPVRQTEIFIMPVFPIANWFAAPDEALSALDQRLIAMQEVIMANADMQSTAVNQKLDGLKLDVEAKEIYGTSNGVKKGTAISLEELGDAIAENTEDGMIVINTFDEEEEE